MEIFFDLPLQVINKQRAFDEVRRIAFGGNLSESEPQSACDAIDPRNKVARAICRAPAAAMPPLTEPQVNSQHPSAAPCILSRTVLTNPDCGFADPRTPQQRMEGEHRLPEMLYEPWGVMGRGFGLRY